MKTPINITTILKRLEPYQNSSYGVRAVAQLTYLAGISRARDGRYDTQLEEAGFAMLQEAELFGAISQDMMERLEQKLAALTSVAKEYTLHMVSHAHIDMNWMWGYHETVSITLETFRTVLQLMKEYPGFTYSQSQASVYRIVEEYEPEMLEEIKARVKEGRWELSASTWVEGDKNMASGESQCRHLLHTKQYLSELFDIDPDSLRLDYEPDTFGHGLYEPEILQAAGVDWLYHCRGCDQRDIYRWKAPSGKEILVWQEPKWYIAVLDPLFLADYPAFTARVGDGSLRDLLVVYGIGDHGGGPTRRDLETIQDMQRWPLFPHIQFSRYDIYYKILESKRDLFPVYEGEVNFVFDGCYTSQARLKMANSLAEKRLYDADVLSALANLSGKPIDNHSMMANAWRHTLFNQFHDILPGSCEIDSREWSMGKFQESLAAANTTANKALRALTAQIDTSGIAFDENRRTLSEGAGIGYNMSNPDLYPFSFTERGRGSVRIWHIFNTTPFDRDEFAEITMWDYPGKIEDIALTDMEGNDLPFCILVPDEEFFTAHHLTKFMVRVQVPAFGYTTCMLKPAKEASPAKELTTQFTGPRRNHAIGDVPYQLENDQICATFDPVTCALVSLWDKQNACELVNADGTAGCFEYVEENPRYEMTAWRVGPAMHKVNLNHTYPVRVTTYEKNDVLHVLTYQIDFRNSTLEVRISLDAAQKALNYAVKTDWIEKGSKEMVPALRFLMHPAYTCSSFRYTTGNGSIVRGELPHDVPSLGTMEFLPDGHRGAHLALFAETKYGFRGNGIDSGVHLIRSSHDPDPHPDLGRHYLHLAVGTAVSEADTLQTFTCATHKLAPMSGYAHEGTRPMTGQLLDCSGRCTISSLHVNRVGNTVLRVFNPYAAEEIFSITAVQEVYPADTLERITAAIEKQDGTAAIAVPAYSYQTLVLK